MRRRYTIREVTRFLQIEADDLVAALRREGLFESDELSPREAEELRVASLLMQELGVNPAGVDVALHLRRRLLCLEERMRVLVRELQERH